MILMYMYQKLKEYVVRSHSMGGTKLWTPGYGRIKTAAFPHKLSFSTVALIIILLMKARLKMNSLYY